MPDLFEREQFETLYRGKKTDLYHLSSEKVQVSICTYGARIVELIFKEKDLVLGYETIEQYITSKEQYFGAVVGPVCNRIAPANAEIDGRLCTFDSKPFILHSNAGLTTAVWDVISHNDDELILRTVLNEYSGFPGNTEYTTVFELRGNEFKVSILAKSDANTIINCTIHPFFNFSETDILQHYLCINADNYTEVDGNCVACKITPVEGSVFDFRAPKAIGKDIEVENEQLAKGRGYDHNYCINGSGLREAAILSFEDVKMTVHTNEKGLQLYSGNWLDGMEGKYNRQYAQRTAVCLEAEAYPNTCNVPEFGSIYVPKGEEYENCLILQFE